jgi:ABC-type amino acid transport substrate-binding protein
MEQAVTLLHEGQVMAVAGDRADLLGATYTSQNLAVLSLRLTEVPLATGLVPGDSAFRDLVNLTFQAMKAEGQFSALYAVWFDGAPPLPETWPGTPYRSLRLEGVALAGD